MSIETQSTSIDRIVRLSELEAKMAKLALLPIFHGTPVSPHEMGLYIEPRQSLTKDYDGNMVPHGDPAVSSSDRAHPFPVIRSLLHAAHPSLVASPDLPLSFGREVDINGKAHYFTSAVALRALARDRARGYVYGSEGKGASDAYPGREDLGERRSSYPLLWLLVAETHTEDLPDFLKVIDAPQEKTWEFLDALPHNEAPTRLADEMGVSLVDISAFLANTEVA